jgi:hypothetical protein
MPRRTSYPTEGRQARSLNGGNGRDGGHVTGANIPEQPALPVKLIQQAYPVNPVRRQPKSWITAGISVPAMRFW